MVLKHRDKELLQFEWTGDTRIRILSINDAERRFLPLLTGSLKKRIFQAINPKGNVGVKLLADLILNASEQEVVKLILRNFATTELELANQLGITVCQTERILAALKNGLDSSVAEQIKSASGISE